MIDLHRRRKRVTICSIEDGRFDRDNEQSAFHNVAALNSDPAQIVVSPVMEERLQQALAALPGNYRTVVWMCDVEQQTYHEIAEAMHCALGTVRSRIHRARIMLRQHLDSGLARSRKQPGSQHGTLDK